jgi:hypothetical protein
VKTVQLLFNPLHGKISCLKLLLELWNTGGMILTEENKGLGEKYVRLPLCHHMSHKNQPGIDPGPPQ